MLKKSRSISWRALLCAVALSALAACGDPALPVLGSAPDFALTDQEGGTLRGTELEGTVWVAGFVFTNCPDICPVITTRMAQLRDSLAARDLLGDRVRMVSVTVDPDRDTPAVLRAYAAIHGGSRPAEWAFLTGPAEEVLSTIEDGFRVAAMPLPPAAGDAHEAHEAHDHDDAAANYSVLHTDHVLVFDREGQLRAIHAGLSPDFVPDALRDVRRLVGGGAFGE